MAAGTAGNAMGAANQAVAQGQGAASQAAAAAQDAARPPADPQAVLGQIGDWLGQQPDEVVRQAGSAIPRPPAA